MQNKKNLINKQWAFVLVIVATISLMIFNYYFTFQKFIPHTQTERSACNLISTREKFKAAKNIDAWTAWVNKLSESNYDIYNNYKEVIGSKGCKTLNQLYIEELGLILVGATILILIKKS